MKRLIKYHSNYASDKSAFSHSGTTFEVLPELVDDSAGFEELKALAKKHGLRIGRKFETLENNLITHSVNMMEVKEKERFNGKEVIQVYLGFAKLPSGYNEGPLKPTNKLNSKITKKQAQAIVEETAYGVSDVGEHIDGNTIIVKSGWEYYTTMRLLGYHHENFEKILKAEDYGFYDDTTRCDGDDCYLFDSRDNGYTYNHRHVEGIGMLGVNCGCYDEHCKLNFEEEYADDHKKAIDRSTGNDLEKEGKIARLETFIGGMTDGRGGYFCGKPTREGTPEAILEEYQERFPKKTFLFIHEESGQFQTYFSIAEIVKQKKKAA